MPPAEYGVLDPGLYQLRHIAPLSVAGSPGIVNPDGIGYQVLGQTLYAKPLPANMLPHSADLTDGQYILRLGDAGEFALTFPNRDASDGQPYRSRFDTDGHVEFIEISRENEPEAVGCIVKVTADRQKVVVGGYDGLWLLKDAFERDCTLVMAPRDVVEKYTQVPVPLVADGFVGTILDTGVWTQTLAVGGSASVSDGWHAQAPGVADGAQLTSTGAAIPTGAWSATVNFVVAALPLPATAAITITAGPLAGYLGLVSIVQGETRLLNNTSELGALAMDASLPGPHTIQIRCDGRSISAYFDGNLIGSGATDPTVTTLPLTISVNGGADINVTLASVRVYQPFLMRGADKGDYVLPGGYTTYPAGGLHGRYYNDLDLQSDPARLSHILQPARTIKPGPYADQLDPVTSWQPNPPGAAPTNWSARWFGSVWLPLASRPGTYTFGVELPNPSGVGTACRLWVGKTLFGQQIIDQWTFTAANAIPLGVVSSTTLAGTNTDGTLTAKDGWYPIILEYAVDAPGSPTAPRLEIYTTSAYTDPAGATIGLGGVLIPPTSLSPLGCIDQRYQGTSYFDIVQQTAQAVGFQFWAKPRTLESGLFPASVAPRVREGRDWDERIQQDDIDRRSGINNVQNITDASDFASSIEIAGAGLPDGVTQLFAEVIDPATQARSLFDLQAWVDASDISFQSLLAARGQAELGQRVSSWQNITGDPMARNRLADTIPLTGRTQGQLRWLPGDGVFLDLPDVNVVDRIPRQMLQITRNILPEGRASTSIGFRQRPKDPVSQVRRQLLSASRPQRAFQGQYVAITGTFRDSGSVAAGATDAGYSGIVLQASDRVVSAKVVITIISAGQAGLVVNGVDRTADLVGPWGPAVPVSLDVSRLATPSPAGQLYVQLKNVGAGAATFQYQLVAVVVTR